MANKQALRELQTRLAERLQEARTQSRGKSWLAVECGGAGLLFPLRDAGEIFPLAPLQPVPHSHPWFLGVSNLRGNLHGVVDLAAFLGLAAGEANREQARLVGFNQSFELNCVLQVERLAGLRSEAELSIDGEAEAAADVDAGAARPAFAGARYRDVAARVWQELDLAALATEDAFLRIVG
jgi:twitching motility protein PilI